MYILSPKPGFVLRINYPRYPGYCGIEYQWVIKVGDDILVPDWDGTRTPWLVDQKTDLEVSVSEGGVLTPVESVGQEVLKKCFGLPREYAPEVDKLVGQGRGRGVLEAVGAGLKQSGHHLRGQMDVLTHVDGVRVDIIIAVGQEWASTTELESGFDGGTSIKPASIHLKKTYPPARSILWRGVDNAIQEILEWIK